MSSKLLFLLLTLAVYNFSTPSAAAKCKAAATTPPAIHIFSVVADKSPPVNIDIKAGGFLRGSAQLGRGQDYEIKADDVNDVYYASAVHGLTFTSFHAYEPGRDKGKAAVFWRADDWGFAISHDKVHFEKVAPCFS